MYTNVPEDWDLEPELEIVEEEDLPVEDALYVAAKS